MKNGNSVKCPNCGTEISVNELMYQQIETQIKKENEITLQKKENEFKQKLNDLKQEKEKLLLEKESIDEQIESKLKERLLSEKQKITTSVKEKIQEEMSEQINSMRNELAEKSNLVKDLNKTKADMEKLKREKEEMIDKINFEKEQEFNLKLKDEKAKMQAFIEEKNQMRFKELEKQLDDQKKLAEEMRRKAEQGSMQLQGEVQELAIQELLSSMFPYDEVNEVPKGVKGADVIHVVKNRIGNDCGKIIYESKRTKAFGKDWIDKLKSDAVLTKADVCILVTETMPDESDQIMQKEGVWICSFKDFKNLVIVIRDSMIKINEAYATQLNKGDKMHILYDYLTGNEFKLQIGAIIDGFTSLHTGYINEKKAMERIWKEREKQLEKVLLNTNHFIGSIKGIASIDINQLHDDSSIKMIE